MSTFQQMEDDLTLMGMANINQTNIGQLLNKCNREEVESHPWSFLYTNIILWSQKPYSTGTLTLTQGSNIITGVGTTFTPNVVGWFLNVGATLTVPLIVNAFLDSATLQLSAAWLGASASGLGFSLYPRYYDVYPLIEVTQVAQVDTLIQTAQRTLNRIDPARVSTGGDPALRWADGPFTNDSPPHYQIELWPRPSSYLPYIVDGKMGPVDMLNPNDQPQLPSAVLEAKAMMYLAQSAYASNGNDKWFTLAQKYQADYDREKETAIAADNRRKITLGRTAEDSSGVNLGIDYVASHDAFGPRGNG